MIYQLGEEVVPHSPYSYMAEWTLEGEHRWAQDQHLGCRWPAVEGDEIHKPFWKPSHVERIIDVARPYVADFDRILHQKKLWACLNPGCRARFSSIFHLRGHHLYAHSEYQ